MLSRRCVIPVVIFALVCVGCATLINGQKQSVTINSIPTGATATVDGQQVITPATVSLRRNRRYHVTVEKAGYLPAEATIKRQVSLWVAGNVIFGGLIGLAIDFGGGAAYKLSPKTVTVTLEKAP